jgi:hypothetical protein
MISTVGNDSSSTGWRAEAQRQWLPWSALEIAQTQALVDENMRGFFLRGLWDERNPFCPLTAMEMVGGELATVR